MPPSRPAGPGRAGRLAGPDSRSRRGPAARRGLPGRRRARTPGRDRSGRARPPGRPRDPGGPGAAGPGWPAGPDRRAIANPAGSPRGREPRDRCRAAGHRDRGRHARPGPGGSRGRRLAAASTARRSLGYSRVLAGRGKQSRRAMVPAGDTVPGGWASSRRVEPTPIRIACVARKSGRLAWRQRAYSPARALRLRRAGCSPVPSTYDDAR